MSYKRHSNTWLLFVQCSAMPGLSFNDLIDHSGNGSFETYEGAWTNIIVRAKTLIEASEIATLGLAEKGFKVVLIDKAENLASLIEYNEVKEEVVKEADWLLTTNFVFMISDRIFPYTNE